MNASERATATEIVNTALDRAEKTWDKVGSLMLEEAIKTAKRSIPTDLPGYPAVEPDKPLVDDFIALVADIRDSTTHLLQAISPKSGARVTELERVFYETSAALPLFAYATRLHSGHETEYLGDGILAFFRAREEDCPDAIYNAFHAAEDCLQGNREILNPILNRRYGLPNLQVGVGLAHSRAIITTVGLGDRQHAKAFGKAVFHATKLSQGAGEIRIDNCLRLMWPSSPGGPLRFEEVSYNEGRCKGYVAVRQPTAA